MAEIEIDAGGGEVEAVQAAAALAAAEAAGAANVRAEQAQADALAAQAEAQASGQAAAAAVETSAAVAASQVTPEEIDARVESKMQELGREIAAALRPVEPVAEVKTAEPPPRDEPPRGVKAEKKKSFRDRWLGK